MENQQNRTGWEYNSLIGDYRRETFIGIATLAELVKASRGRKGAQVMRKEVGEAIARHEVLRAELEGVMRDINMVAVGLKSMRSLERKLTTFGENGWRQEYQGWPMPNKDDGSEPDGAQVGEEQSLNGLV